MFGLHDIVEFELAPDGFNSRYTSHGKRDRGVSGTWLSGEVIEVEHARLAWTPDKFVVRTKNGDLYTFYVGIGTSAAYPLSAIRLVSKLKSGKIRMVDKGGHWVTEEV